MADGRNPYGASRWVLIIVVALGLIALVLWQSGVFQGPPENTRQVYKADVKDLSGGSFVVSDPNKPAIKVTVPDVKMTTVPATPTPSPSASPAR